MQGTVVLIMELPAVSIKRLGFFEYVPIAFIVQDFLFI